MTWEFNPSSTPQQVSKYEDEESNNSKQFVRDDSDNKLFPRIQVKDIRDIITEDCVGAWDFDGVVYRACSNMENRLIKVTNKDEGIEEVLQNVTTFKGRGKNVSETSWLGLLNVKREVDGLTPLQPDDFVVEPFQELKMEKDKALEQVKIQIFLKIKQVKQQYRIPKVKLILGGGDNFRNELNQVKMYKSGRKDTLRPLLLKEIRDWVINDLDTEYAHPLPDGRRIEADDLSNFYGVKGYQHFKKTGKFNYLEISPDKDALAQSGKLLINPDTYTGENNPLRGKFKFPQAMLIHTTDQCVGDVELVVKGGEKSTSKELKGCSLKFLMFQSILGKDSSDTYNCLGDLGVSLGDTEAYRILKPLKTPQGVIQKCIDVAAEKLPYGVQYTTHKGEEKDVDTLTYLNEYFKTAYMLRHANDKVDLFKLCKAFKVDTSKVVGNNILTPPVRKYVGSEDHVKELQNLLQDIVKQDMKGIKSMKKADQAPVLDSIKDKLSNIDFGGHYKMVQINKETGEEVEYEVRS